MVYVKHNSRRIFQPLVLIDKAAAFVLLSLFAACLALQSQTVQAQPCIGLGGWVVSVEGDLTIDGQPTQMGNEFCLGEEIIAGPLSRAAIRLAATQTVVRVKQNTTLVVEQSDDGGTLLEMLKGVLYLFSRNPQSLSVISKKPYMNAAIEGTEFVIESTAQRSEVTVIEGSVRVSNASGNILINSGEAASSGGSGLPQRRAVVNPLDAAQWALYYPSIGETENTTDTVRSAAQFLARGDTKKAELALSASPIDATSLALQSIIAVTRNQTDDAIRLARRAVNEDPGSSVAYTALSYAQQAEFDIDQALGSAITAVQNDVSNADALARQAELQLGVDETNDALASARKAVEIDAQNSRARTILGFVYLVRLNVSEATAAFTEAVALDPGDPLPRLGLGLAVIRDGSLTEGREHIEVAASLDPGNALVRSYLGKAYSEEGQSADASEQFALAQRIDPQDPTPWFYDALLDQALNRPVSAYEKINKARALNDNRLIYQSRLLVDKSAAAGELSLARVYTDLGFEQLAINESTRSIATDPTNYAAYRLLADSYAGRERHESARSNVMFQASLLQPMTITPVQPYAQESNLLILPGTNPVDASVNEYSPLFDRQGFQLAGSLVAGNSKTLGDNLVFSGLHDRFAYSFGQFYYETEGFRTNNDIEHKIYHGNVQAKVLQNLFIQADYQSRETVRGDLVQNSDQDDFDPDLRINVENGSPRIGLRWELAPRSTLLVSGRTIDDSFDTLTGSGIEKIVLAQETSGHEASARFTYRDTRWNHTVGIESYDLSIDTSLEFKPCSQEPCSFGQGQTDSSFSNYYYYADLQRSQQLQWTLGLSYTTYNDEQQMVNDSDLDPKLGIRWTPSGADELRFSLSRGTRRRNVVDQTLEPTTLAGFNQIYDNWGGSRYINTGFAYDRKIAKSTSLGLQLFHRQIDVRQLRANEPDGTLVPVDDSQSEATARGYWSQILHPAMSLDLNILYERFERDDTRRPDGSPHQSFPLLIETVSIPVGIRFNHPSGFFARGEFSRVYQRIDRYADPDAGENTSFQYDKKTNSFSNFNLSVGYRLPKHHTTLRLDITNLFDDSFQFQGHDIQTGATSSPRYLPKQLITARVNFLFR